MPRPVTEPRSWRTSATGDGSSIGGVQKIFLHLVGPQHRIVLYRSSWSQKIKNMRHDLTVSQSVEINAPASKVWNALTNPEIIKEYLFGTETITDWKVGSDIIFQGEYGENKEHKYRDKGIVKENVLNKLLSYSYWSGFSGLEDKPENYSLVTYTLKDTGNNQTIFTWTQKGFATEDGYQHSLSGMKEFLEQIKGIVER